MESPSYKRMLLFVRSIFVFLFIECGESSMFGLIYFNSLHGYKRCEKDFR